MLLVVFDYGREVSDVVFVRKLLLHEDLFLLVRGGSGCVGDLVGCDGRRAKD